MKTLKTAILFLLILPNLAPPAHADDSFAKKHPRRAEVLRRDRNLYRRTERAERSGKITEKQADRLEREERGIRRQEQAEARANGGYITKAEQRQLNREENGVQRQLRNDERKDAAQN
jgi:hypothetical protein